MKEFEFDEALANYDDEGKSIEEIKRDFWEAGEESRYLTYVQGHAEGVLSGWKDGYNVGLSVSGNSVLRKCRKQ